MITAENQLISKTDHNLTTHCDTYMKIGRKMPQRIPSVLQVLFLQFKRFVGRGVNSRYDRVIFHPERSRKTLGGNMERFGIL